MKIGFDVSDLSTNRADGTTRYTRELAKRLPYLGERHRWQYFAPSDFRLNKSLPPNVEKVLSPWPKYWTQLRLPLDLYREKPEVLFMPIQQIPYIRPKHMRTVAVIHDLAVHRYPEQFRYKDWLLLHVFSAYVARRADAIIAVSKATADDIDHYYGRSRNVFVVYHGVDHETFRVPGSNEREKSWQKLSVKYPKLRRPYILFVGQIQPRKNITRLIEAFEQFLLTQPEFQLVIAGGHGWLQKPIVERMQRSQAANKILKLGRVPDDLLPALYWQAEVFTLPSLYEGFGLPILEAMASGVPTVTSNVSSLPEVAGEAAVLVDPMSVESITAGLIEAIRRRDKLIPLGVKWAETFTWECTARQSLPIVEGESR